jgi:hypothetical protein
MADSGSKSAKQTEAPTRRRGIVVGGSVFAVVGAILTWASTALPTLNFRPIIVALASLLLAVVVAGGDRLNQLRQHAESERARERKLARGLSCSPMPSFRNALAFELGVHVAQRPAAPPGLPAYLPRDVDPQVSEALEDFPAAVLMGPAYCGKIAHGVPPGRPQVAGRARRRA